MYHRWDMGLCGKAFFDPPRFGTTNLYDWYHALCEVAYLMFPKFNFIPHKRYARLFLGVNNKSFDAQSKLFLDLTIVIMTLLLNLP